MLVGNGVRIGGGPMRVLGGAGIQSINQANWYQNGARRNLAEGEASLSGQSNKNGFPGGVSHPAAWVLPQKAGAIASRYNITGAAEVAGGNLAGGLYGVGTAVGSGSLTEVNLTAIGNILAALSGSGTVSSADIIGNIEAAATLLGAGDVTGALISLLNGSALLTGAGDLNGSITGGLEGVATLTGAGSLVGAIAGVVEALATVSGSGNIIPADIVGVMNAVATLVGAGDIDGAITALGHAAALVEGEGTISNALPRADAEISALISASGDVLTANSIVQTLMEYTIETGFDFKAMVRLSAAILAGKTEIVDNGDGTATVTFRTVSDDADAAIFDMVGSSRADRTDGDL